MRDVAAKTVKDVNVLAPPNVVLYTRAGCHLCDEALAILTKHGISPHLIDIDTDQDLVKLYNTCVPVVTFDGKERFRGEVNETLLRRLIHDG